MKNNIKVSVIMPVYQVENYLERAIDSVLAQTLNDIELILVDDGSTDCSPGICDRYAVDYPGKIKVIHKQNNGLGMARNSGIKAACGEYLAFIDSDDTVEPDMYLRMYEKAMEKDYDIVMCDVKIIYVEKNTVSVSKSYTRGEIDLSDYIANGNNITYSVNKIFKRQIFEHAKYEKMLFEDISLIPALLTKYQNIGYVSEPFYSYYRRSNSISTTVSGDMIDIIAAFENFINNGNPAYREEIVYCTAKQINWNMNTRTLFKADFIDFLKKYKKDFLLNSYISKDKNIKGILEHIKKDLIPDNIICVHIGREIPPEYIEKINKDFPKTNFIDANINSFELSELPKNVIQAVNAEKYKYVEEYLSLKILSVKGGIIVSPDMLPDINLKRLRINRIFFGFKNNEEVLSGCFGAVKEHYVIEALLSSYEDEKFVNQAFLPLKERLRDFLIIHFGLQANGRKQLLKNEIQIYLPSVLSFDMKDGENCCKLNLNAPEGYELISESVLKIWSDRIMENWNLYKLEANKKSSVKTAGPPPDSISDEVNQKLQELAALYENSTSWKITKPIRALGKIFKKGVYKK